MANKDNPIVGRRFERIAQDYFQKHDLFLNRECSLLIGVSKKKEHAFDLGSVEPPVLVECKAHTWTKGKNSPSAKISVWNETMYYFYLAPKEFRKILFVLKSVRAGQTLAEHYVSRFEHLIPERLEIWEYDPEIETAYQIY